VVDILSVLLPQVEVSHMALAWQVLAPRWALHNPSSFPAEWTSLAPSGRGSPAPSREVRMSAAPAEGGLRSGPLAAAETALLPCYSCYSCYWLHLEMGTD